MDIGISCKRRSVHKAAQHIMAHSLFQKNAENDGIDYFKNNISVAKDVNVYLDAIKIVYYSRCDENKYKRIIQL